MSDVVYGLLWGLGAVVGVWLVWKLLTRGFPQGLPLSLKSLATGKDNRLSISKLQASVWFIAIYFAYVATYSVRVRYGDVAALGELPENLMWLLAFTTGGALGAKWHTSYKVRGGTLEKDEADVPKLRDLISDDSGYSAWNKLQLFYFTVLALAIFIIGVIRELQLAEADAAPMLPNVDTTLLILMGISQAGYLGKKVVTD